MTAENELQTTHTLLTQWAKGASTPEPDRIDVLLSVNDLLAAVRALHDARVGYLISITGLDWLGKNAALAQDERWKELCAISNADPATAPGPLEVLYHFAAGTGIITLRVLTLRDAAAVPSVCDIIPSATFFERELSEMFGIRVVNTPDPAHLFLPDDWQPGVYPLRKDFVPEKHDE
jgi:NADH:ubiquinone oxidoreductase subunit C